MRTEVDDSPFPARLLYPERILYRLHRTANDPLHFSSNGGGRFDLTAIAGSGTCYLAVSPVGAYVEVFGRLGTISDSDITERSLTEIELQRTLRVADLTDRSVLGRFGISGEMSTSSDYRESQQLASRLYEAGLDGVYYTTRHDPAFSERSVAVFGGSAEAKILATTTDEIPQHVIDQCTSEFALYVLPRVL